MNYKIPFNKPLFLGKEKDYLEDVLERRELSGSGFYTKKCEKWFEGKFSVKKSIMAPSCTAALEMAALALNLEPEDEVIMPSFTFVSTANAFALRGVKIVFIDIRPDTMNIDENLIEEAITAKTRAIVPVHYAGVGCEMDKIMEIAQKYHLVVVEDAAQGMMAYYKGKALGTIGDFGAYSFHETKNYTCGEGGVILINNPLYQEKCEIIRDKGTNRKRFLEGEIDRYSWVELGSSYVISEFQAAYLYGQLEFAQKIKEDRLRSWNYYYDNLTELEKKGNLELPFVPSHCEHNGHIFYFKVENHSVRAKLLKYLKRNGIYAVFHYVPLHSSVGGKKYSRFHGKDRYTTHESERLLRLPLWYGLPSSSLDYILEKIYQFF